MSSPGWLLSYIDFFQPLSIALFFSAYWNMFRRLKQQGKIWCWSFNRILCSIFSILSLPLFLKKASYEFLKYSNQLNQGISSSSPFFPLPLGFHINCWLSRCQGKSRIKIQSHLKHPQDHSLTLWFLSATTLSSYWDTLEKNYRCRKQNLCPVHGLHECSINPHKPRNSTDTAGISCDNIFSHNIERRRK